jgi:hypothetical protein
MNIGEIEILSNSIGAFRNIGTLDNVVDTVMYVGRTYGVQPPADIIITTSWDANSVSANPIAIDDYFGQGPRIIGGLTDMSFRAPSSADINVNGKPAMNAININSLGIPQPGISIARHFGVPRSPSDSRAFTNVNSGIPLVVRWPFMTTNSINVDPTFAVGRIVSTLRGRTTTGVAGTCYINSLEVSSGFTWAGNSTGAGSFWVAKAVFIPTESGSTFVDITFPLQRSKAGILAIGRPEVNSA